MGQINIFANVSVVGTASITVFPVPVAANLTVTVNSIGYGSYTVPTGYSMVDVEAIGGGGGGSGGGWGGGGGAYAKTANLAVTTGQTIYYLVANTANGCVNNQTTAVGCQPSWVNISGNAAPTSTANGCLAPGGVRGTYEFGVDGTTRIGGTGGGQGNTANIPGQVNAIGTTIFVGGNTNHSASAEGGGGGAGSQGAGGQASGATTGIGGTGGATEGGAGGNGNTTAGSTGNPGSSYGGGGGGGSTNGSGTGGQGAQGLIRFTFHN